jgi:alpha-N-arabinofuranosidase
MMLLAATIVLSQLATAQSTVLTVKADKPGVAIQQNMWGIFFEDINFAADGEEPFI